MSFQEALLVGLIAGGIASFILTKQFAYRSHSWRVTHWEAARFTIVNLLGSTLYWVVSMIVGAYIMPHFLERSYAEIVGSVAGAGTMAISSYIGHRVFTYRTGRLPVTKVESTAIR